MTASPSSSFSSWWRSSGSSPPSPSPACCGPAFPPTSAAIGDIRSVVSAQAAYHSASGGFYGTLDCLLAPSGGGCIPSYPTTAPTFVDSQLASFLPKSGYARSADETAVVPQGLTCYVYHATPVNIGLTGVRGFAGSCSGLLCQTPDGTPVAGGGTPGSMDPGCITLQ